MYRQQYKLHAALSEIDYRTGIAYNAIIPILWACSVTENLGNSAIKAVFVVDGVVDNTFVRKIIEKTITIVMHIFEIQVPRPEYIFQASSEQFSAGQGGSEFELQYVHRNLCDGFKGNNDFVCVDRIKGSFISTYNIADITTSIYLNNAETTVKNDFNIELSKFIGLHVLTISPTKNNVCPYATVQQVDMTTDTSMKCFICTSSNFFRNGICTPCTRMDNVLCAFPLQKRACSWVDNEKCVQVLT
jgi:hypothetical protein